MEQYHIALTKKQVKDLNALSGETGNSIASIIRIAINEYFKNLENR